jgi:hypothetical protein
VSAFVHKSPPLVLHVIFSVFRRLLALGNLKEANQFRDRFLSHVTTLSATPLMNFVRFLLLTLEVTWRLSNSLFPAICLVMYCVVVRSVKQLLSFSCFAKSTKLTWHMIQRLTVYVGLSFGGLSEKREQLCYPLFPFSRWCIPQMLAQIAKVFYNVTPPPSLLDSMAGMLGMK